MHRLMVLAATSVLLTGCATIFEGTRQDIRVVTNPPGASCAFERQGENIGVISQTPGLLTVRKLKYDITIKCDKPGYQQAQYLNHSGTSAAIAGNIAADVILTLGVSSIVDSANGADNKYDSAVNITLVPLQPTTIAVPPSTSEAAAPQQAATPSSPAH